MEVWLLTFYIVFGGSFLGGQYMSADRCEQSARAQLVHWRAISARSFGAVGRSFSKTSPRTGRPTSLGLPPPRYSISVARGAQAHARGQTDTR
jgi:hypothetical protein